jgi:hypothetical protein
MAPFVAKLNATFLNRPNRYYTYSTVRYNTVLHKEPLVNTGDFKMIYDFLSMRLWENMGVQVGTCSHLGNNSLVCIRARQCSLKA